MDRVRLQNYKNIKKEIKQLLEQITVIESRLYSPKAQHLTGMPAAQANGNAVEDMSAEHMELLNYYHKRVDELDAEQLEIEKALELLEPMHRMLLRYRYIEGHKWEDICVLMSYSWRQVHRNHHKALEQLRERTERVVEPAIDPATWYPETIPGDGRVGGN